MKPVSTLLLAAAITLAGVAPVLAHHSFASEFDAAKHIKVTGTVTKVEWRNPHAYFYVDAEDGKGKMQNWAMELGSPNALARRGWNRNSLKEGDVVIVEGSQARDGALKGNASSVTLADGKRLFSTGATPD
jgi:translation initiation factor IF-1